MSPKTVNYDGKNLGFGVGFGYRNNTKNHTHAHCCPSVTPSSHTMESSAAVCSVRTTAHTLPYHALSMGMTQQFFVFVPGDLDLWPLAPKFELGQDFCTMHLTAKFHHPTLNRSKVIVFTNKLTNKQTPLKASTFICFQYATPVEISAGRNWWTRTHQQMR